MTAQSCSGLGLPELGFREQPVATEASAGEKWPAKNGTALRRRPFWEHSSRGRRDLRMPADLSVPSGERKAALRTGRGANGWGGTRGGGVRGRMDPSATTCPALPFPASLPLALLGHASSVLRSWRKAEETRDAIHRTPLCQGKTLALPPCMQP